MMEASSWVGHGWNRNGGQSVEARWGIYQAGPASRRRKALGCDRGGAPLSRQSRKGGSHRQLSAAKRPRAARGGGGEEVHANCLRALLQESGGWIMAELLHQGVPLLATNTSLSRLMVASEGQVGASMCPPTQTFPLRALAFASLTAGSCPGNTHSSAPRVCPVRGTGGAASRQVNTCLAIRFPPPEPPMETSPCFCFQALRRPCRSSCCLGYLAQEAQPGKGDGGGGLRWPAARGCRRPFPGGCGGPDVVVRFPCQRSQ